MLQLMVLCICMRCAMCNVCRVQSVCLCMFKCNKFRNSMHALDKHIQCTPEYFVFLGISAFFVLRDGILWSAVVVVVVGFDCFPFECESNEFSGHFGVASIHCTCSDI